MSSNTVKAKQASEITLPPKDLGWGTVLHFLIEKFSRIDAAIWRQRVADGKVHWFGGEVIDANTTFLIASHDPRLYERCSRLLTLKDGVLVDNHNNSLPSARRAS